MALAAFTACMFAFRATTGSVKGTINPPEAGKRVWVISPRDTFQANVRDGSFEITQVKAGTYQLTVEANAPYRNVVRDAITVSEGSTFDVGEIRMGKASH